jgi:hypothetical protein
MENASVAELYEPTNRRQEDTLSSAASPKGGVQITRSVRSINCSSIAVSISAVVAIPVYDERSVSISIVVAVLVDNNRPITVAIPVTVARLEHRWFAGVANGPDGTRERRGIKV